MEISKENTATTFVEKAASCNACKQCSPLGASIAFKGIKACIPLIHGSQGCATYIRRYLISHYREPVDIASSSFSEESTIFGGNKNFIIGINNIIQQYNPELIGISSTCLSETIGEDVNALIHEFKSSTSLPTIPAMVFASTPSYMGTHVDGFHQAVAATVSSLARKEYQQDSINIFPGFVSPEDLRYLKRIFSSFGLKYVMFPDYSETLDNPTWEQYHRIPEGGTSIDDIVSMGSAKASIELGFVLNKGMLKGRMKDTNAIVSAGDILLERFGIKNYRMAMPIGVHLCDQFFELIKKISGTNIPIDYLHARGRLIDAYVDGHKYLKSKKAILYGDEDMVISLASFLLEIGIDLVLCASGGESGRLDEYLRLAAGENYKGTIKVIEGVDFETIDQWIPELKPDIMIGNSKGYYLARKYSIPLIRVGFPIHDRIGAQRIQHLGYEGTLGLYDRIVNAIIEKKQDSSAVGSMYM